MTDTVSASMKIAGAKAAEGFGVILSFEQTAAIYRAMLAASPQGEGSSGDTTNMIAPVEAVAWRDKVGLGRPLYEAFWLRNGGNAPAWCDQASAIRFMWDAIADDAVQALAVTPPQPDAQGWRDIATAPRAGTSILAICASAYSPVAGVTWWNGSWTHYSRPAEKWHGGVGKWFPTHWMPLPPPPSAHPAPIKPSGDTGELRERVARIIDPSAFLFSRDELDAKVRHHPHDAAYALADEILDLIQSERGPL